MFTLHWNDCGFSTKQVHAVAKRLSYDVHQLHHVCQERMYGNDAASVILPFDKRHVAAAKVLAKKCGKADLVIVVGIGGSNLGTLAIQQAVTGIFDQRILYADTVDPDATHHIIDEAKRVLKHHGHVVVNVISKSGTTTETIANFAALMKALPKERLHVVVTTDVGSHFEQFGRSQGYDVLSIPTRVGGRYSVFSTVGLFPLAALGVDVDALVEGAHDALQHCLRTNKENPALILASIAYLHHQKGRKVHDTFLFSKDLEGYGRWYRQLLAESIGKTEESGVVPTVSVGSTDLHSVGQLDLAGPDTTYYRFVTVKKTQHDLHVPDGYGELVPDITDKSFSTIMDAILKGTQAAFKKHKRPFIEIQLPDKSEETLGALLQTEMVGVMLLGHLLRVDPFDQPAVEEYKSVTRRLLSK